MLKQLTRTFITGVLLLLLFATASALGAHGSRPATLHAAHRAAHRAGRRASHQGKTGQRVHHKRIPTTPPASTSHLEPISPVEPSPPISVEPAPPISVEPLPNPVEPVLPTPVEPIPPNPPPPLPPPAPTNTVLPSIGGVAEEGQTLSASTGTWSGSPTSYSYQWQDCNAAGEACANTSGVATATYTLTAGEVGGTVRVIVSATNTGGTSSVASADTAVIVADPPPPPPPPPAPTNTTLPSISGSAVAGEVLSAGTGAWTGEPTSYSYHWQACDALGEGCLNVSGATELSYTLTAGEVGGTMRVVVSASNEGGSTEASSDASAVVVSEPPPPPPPPAPTNTALPSVSGSTVEGETLTANAGTWTSTPGSYEYQWQDCNVLGEGCVSVGDATNASYTLAASDVGYTLRVVVTATNAGGSGSASSAATATVVPPAPTSTAPPSISGSTIEGQTLTAGSGTWSGGATSFAYQWQDCSVLGEACVNVSGATAASYVLSAGDVGSTVRVVVTATNASGSMAASSAATATVLPMAPANTTLPTVSGSAIEGQTLSASTGTWSGSPTSFAYQWQDCNASGEGCLNVSGATSASYKLLGGDVGHRLRLVVTAANNGGLTAAASAATVTVMPLPPANTTLPTVSGSDVEGQVLTASQGTWSGSPTSFAYQWQDCNSAGEACASIGAATSATYKLASSDVGHTLRVVVTASNEGGSTPASSAATALVAAVPPPPLPAPTNTVPPLIGGVAEEGKTLTASTGTWTGSPTSYAYQWQACGASGEGCANISGATSSSYKLAAGDVGQTVRVVVTATNGGDSTEASSDASAVVVAEPPPPPPPPTNTVLPSIGGVAEEGKTLSASTGTWWGSPTSYSYQWEDCNAAGEACANTSGATGSSYKLAASDVGHTVRVVVTAKNPGGHTAATSHQTAEVASGVTNNSYRTFYISYTEGNESNDGTSEATPWRRAPGMQGCEKECAAYGHRAGDHFIFEGGVTWPHAVLPLAPPEGREGSGEVGNPDVYGVKESWYAGASYKAPIFDAESAQVKASSCPGRERCEEINAQINISHDDYITIEGLHLIGFMNPITHLGFYNCAVVFAGSRKEAAYESDWHVTIDKVMINEFPLGDHLNVNGFEPNQESEAARCSGVMGHYPSSAGEPEGESLIENSVIEGAPGGSFFEGEEFIPNVTGSKFARLNNMIFPGPGGGTIAGNRLEDCGYPAFPEKYEGDEHGNMIEVIGSSTVAKPFYIHDNVFYGMGNHGGANCEPSFLGLGTTYLWNNVYTHNQSNPIDTEGPESKNYIFNNSIEGSGEGNGYCVQSGHGDEDEADVIKNNLCVTRQSTAGNPGNGHTLRAKVLTENHNTVIESGKLAADHYASNEAAYAFAPTSAGGTGVGKGESLTSLCSATITLCADTSYAGARSPVERPNPGSWDTGAYQW